MVCYGAFSFYGATKTIDCPWHVHGGQAGLSYKNKYADELYIQAFVAPKLNKIEY